MEDDKGQQEQPERPLTTFLKSIEERLGKDSQEKEEARLNLEIAGQEVSLPSSVSYLTTKTGASVFLIGTAHVSQNSVDDVREVPCYTYNMDLLISLEGN